jgi:hypothetical protein
VTTSDASYGEKDVGNVDILGADGEVIAVGKLSAIKFKDEGGEEHWRGHLNAIAPPSAAPDLNGQFKLRFSDGSEHSAFVEQEQTTSQLSPGLDLAVEGDGAPPF